MTQLSLKTRPAPPQASALIEALRGMGYSTATALADLIDNSIAAGATTVDLRFHWHGKESHITVLDDGSGMNDAELFKAMRLGDRSPLDERAPHDLGRFGMGLKTASLSQCRRLTVASKRLAAPSCLRWDLDFLAASPDDGWHLIEGPADGSADLLAPLSSVTSGTLVLWELLDRVVTTAFSEQDFLDLIDTVERHLSMVFQRYLARARRPIRILVNGRPVAPWDPFLVHHPATWSSPIECWATPSGQIEVQCHVLPHKDRLQADEVLSAGGPDGWTAQQGFYVYRNDRLLVGGSWLGLGQGRSWTKEEAHRLARIRLDIPNTADAEWKLDIRKSTARPPAPLRPRLTAIAEDARARARRVFAHRGSPMRPGAAGPLTQAWRAEHSDGATRYRIEDQHPAVRAVLDDAGPLLPHVKAMLRVIEETVPVQRIWLDTAEGHETPRTCFAGEPGGEVKAVLEVMYRGLVQRQHLSPAFARQRLLSTEPFHAYPELVAALPDDLPSPGDS